MTKDSMYDYLICIDETIAAEFVQQQAIRIKELRTERDVLVEFVQEVRRNGDTRLASMAIAALERVKAK